MAAKQTIVKTTYKRTRTRTKKTNTSNKSKRCPKCGRYI